MICVLFGISVLILAVGIFVWKVLGDKLYRIDCDWIYWILNIIGALGMIVSLIAALIIGIDYSNHRVIDEKIALYETENQQIEERIADTVDKYANYETETYGKFDNEDVISLVTLFPELKTDTLVAKQIELYTENNQQIKLLKQEKLNYQVKAWWLFFGGN